MILTTLGEHVNESVIVTLGYMDCVHAGHKSLLELAQKKAAELKSYGEGDIKTAAFTFFNNPFVCLKKDILPVYDFALRAALLNSDVVMAAYFNETFLELSGDAFLKKLIKSANIHGVVAGEDYRFGKGAKFGIYDLRAFLEALSIPLFVGKTVTLNGVKVSSSDVRARLLAGDVAAASELLAAPYTVSGIVIRGTGTGRSMGFPTANLAPKADTLRLAEGVYLTRTRIDGRVYGSITNVGGRPTFEDIKGYGYETFIDGIDDDLYGKYIEVEFIKRIRGIEKFQDAEALRTQLNHDKKSIISTGGF